jgi:hypothetical protein
MHKHNMHKPIVVYATVVTNGTRERIFFKLHYFNVTEHYATFALEPGGLGGARCERRLNSQTAVAKAMKAVFS